MKSRKIEPHTLEEHEKEIEKALDHFYKKLITTTKQLSNDRLDKYTLTPPIRDDGRISSYCLYRVIDRITAQVSIILSKNDEDRITLDEEDIQEILALLDKIFAKHMSKKEEEN
ncbi:MAG: hypothetical protein ACTSRR_09635 [Candidatus Heimdallarchaeaceae archaeon]